MPMEHVAPVDVSRVLSGTLGVGSRVTVRGWVRTRRDSKAGLSFIHLHDGSSFHPLQVVAPKELPNYESEVRKLTSGCAVIARTIGRSCSRSSPKTRRISAADMSGSLKSISASAM